MTSHWTLPAWLVLATLVLVAALVAAMLVAQRRARARSAAALTALAEQVAAIETRLGQRAATVSRAPRADEHEYTITMLGEPERDAADPVPAVPAPLFADLVLRESVVQAASLAAGVRRALAPEMRNRIRFVMRREVKRARKQRRADLRQARREWEARQPVTSR